MDRLPHNTVASASSPAWLKRGTGISSVQHVHLPDSTFYIGATCKRQVGSVRLLADAGRSQVYVRQHEQKDWHLPQNDHTGYCGNIMPS